MNTTIMASTGHLIYLLLEFVAIFVALPLAIALRWIRPPLIPSLWVMTLACLGLLLSDAGFDRRVLWRMGDLTPAIVGLACFVPAATALLLIVRWRCSERLFFLPRNRPGLWLLIVTLYPLLSVYPQGIIYRAFIFQRYAALFPGRPAMVLISAAAFGFMHIAFRNRVAPLLTLVGGVLFACVYDQSQSLTQAAMVHAVFGCWIFTVGLGHYFYGGTASLLAKDRAR